MNGFANRMRYWYRLFQQRRAAVAMAVTLATPMLIVATGLTVDSGYWFQQQESLQSAADAAALSAAHNYVVTGASSATVPVTAANNATGNQFHLTSATVNVASGTVSGMTSFTSTATIPRGSFFSAKGSLFGIGSGFQNASATAVVNLITTTSNTITGGNCLYLTSPNAQQALYASGGARLNSAGCPIYVASNACNVNNGEADSVVADPSAHITSSTVSTQGCIYANTNGGAFVGDSNNGTAGNISHAGAQPDPLAALGIAPPWPTMPATPTAPTGTAYTAAPSLGYNTWSGAQGDCTYMGNYSANCELFPGAYSGMSGEYLNSLVLNEGTSSGTTYISGQLVSHNNGFLTLNGSKYFVSNGIDFEVNNGGTANINASIFNIIGGTSLSNGTWNFGVNNVNNTYYFAGITTGYGTGISWGLNVSAPNVNFGPGTYYFRGGATFPGSNPTVNFAQGTYLFSAWYNNSTGAQNNNAAGATGSGGAMNDNNANITFTGGTYFFDGGLSLIGNSHITFGPGIYYIKNGDLAFGNGSTVTANGATFVLEGTASYQLDGGSAALNLTAPSTNCVAPASYPNTANALPSSSTALPNSYAPYDGTNGQGICGVLIYQARGDATADNIIEGANSTITGVIYAPSASLAVSGGATLSSAVSNGTLGTLALIQSTLSLTGSGTVNLNVASGSVVAATGSITHSTSSQVLLTN